MKATKQTTYNWDAGINVSEEETIAFANYLLSQVGKQSNLSFEIAPKSSEMRLNWDNAKQYCQGLNIDGKTGWRLPTTEELNQMYGSRNNLEKGFYWSSNSGWQNFYNGSHGNGYVRAVRSVF